MKNVLFIETLSVLVGSGVTCLGLCNVVLILHDSGGKVAVNPVTMTCRVVAEGNSVQIRTLATPAALVVSMQEDTSLLTEKMRRRFTSSILLYLQ